MPAAYVLFGDVIKSRRDAVSATAWLRTISAEFAAAYPPQHRIARFEFTQGDELQGLLTPSADPLVAVLRAAFHPRRMEMRWVIVRGQVDPGRGPATQRSGPAFIDARERLITAAARRERLAVRSGDAATDDVLDGIAPLVGDLLAELTLRQREIARLLLVDGLRRADAAERLGVSRATISVAADRAHLRWLGGAIDVIRTLLVRSAPDPATMLG